MNMTEKFQKLSDKIALISNKNMHNPDKTIKLEIKVENLEETYNLSVETLNLKHLTLKEHINKLKLIIEVEQNSKDEIKQIYLNELREMENKVKLLINEERDYMETYIENLFKKLETNIFNIERSTKLQNNQIRISIQQLKENIEIDIPDLRNKLESDTNDRDNTIQNLISEMNLQFNKINDFVINENKNSEENEIDFQNSLQNITHKVKDEFKIETTEREKFEVNILKLLEETTNNLSKLN